MIRPVFLSAASVIALASALFVPAADARQEQAPGERKAEARPFIETSYVIAPERIGEFVIEGSSYDAANKYAGAGFRYALPGHQETRFDVYVYPAGRSAEADAVERGMVEFKAGFAEAEEAGYYGNVRIVEESDFTLELPGPEPGSASPGDMAADAAAPTRDASEREAPGELDTGEAALARMLLEASQHTGRRVSVQLDLLPQGMPMHSDGYLFHKQLYFFKVRVSAARERIDDAGFRALADRAARSLVPAIDVVNIGDCANAVITVDPDGDPQAIAEALVTQSVAYQRENCFKDAATAGITEKSADARVVEIGFDAQDWRGR
ncbi:hypothetical protein [Luteimonas mephitis]|uniref:hypothetical protein n=1 Tax=Luteimonas mephitis TaxID=83615 RepID=UPI000685E500|nr:hypothetical protein [Luteimonas mephitis]